MSITAELDDLLATLRARRLAPAQVQSIIAAYVQNRIQNLGPGHLQELATLEQEASSWLTAQRMSALRDQIRQRIEGRRAVLLRMAEREEPGEQ
jgi:hypothetical protein